MKNGEIVLSKIAHSQRLKSFRTNAVLMLATLMLMVAAATSEATAQTYTVLHNFDGPHGADPVTCFLAQGRDGNLYGTTYVGGTFDYGVVFRITPSGNLKVLYNFDGIHGTYPESGLTLGTDGNFYGTTEFGGDNDFGTIFKITKNGNLTTLYNFTNGEDGELPPAPPVQGTDGNFYGTARKDIGGIWYKITPSGTFASLGPLPTYSAAPLLLAIDRNFYGTTVGWDNKPSVFKITPKGEIKTVYKSMASLSTPVIQGGDGNFYGTESGNGGINHGGFVYKLTPRGTKSMLHNFPDPNYPNDGDRPEGLIQATNGNFYGVTANGGTSGYGVIFQISPDGAYSILLDFDASHGTFPNSTLIQNTNGKIYGVTPRGGTYDRGVVYSLDLGLAPFVSLVTTSRKVGKTVEVLGQGFTGTTAVSFNGTAATFTVVSDTYLKTTVPSGATTGFVTVTTPGGTLTSNQQFRVKP